MWSLFGEYSYGGDFYFQIREECEVLIGKKYCPLRDKRAMNACQPSRMLRLYTHCHVYKRYERIYIKHSS